MARQHSEDFKSEAVRQVTEYGLGVSEVARRLGLSRSSLYGWIRHAEAAASRKPREKPTSELARLKRELAEAREEIHFLKKAAAYFAKERPRGTRS